MNLTKDIVKQAFVATCLLSSCYYLWSVTMNTLLHGLLLLPLGFALGIFYFSCLWFTVQNLPRTQHPILLMVGSGVARLSIALLGFYLMVGGQWERLLIALLGFLLARSLLIARWRPQTSLSDLMLED
jgi:F1F0 ATPase subunit 2